MHAEPEDDEDTGPRHARLALLSWQRLAVSEASYHRAVVMLHEAEKRLYRTRDSRRAESGGGVNASRSPDNARQGRAPGD